MHFIGTTKDLRICLILRMPGFFAEFTLREMKRILRGVHPERQLQTLRGVHGEQCESAQSDPITESLDGPMLRRSTPARGTCPLGAREESGGLNHCSIGSMTRSINRSIR
jgi:hypothetical protein